MTAITDLEGTRRVLRELGRIVSYTKQTLADMAQEGQRARQSKRPTGKLSDPLEHMSEVREGFILSQRTPARVSLSTLRDMVREIITDWAWLEQFNLTFTPPDRPDLLGSQLVVYNHALVALAFVPRLPAEAITFPQSRPSYSDVSVPDHPEALLTRIEEIERILYQADFRPVASLEYGPFRRTYAFFESSSWLVDKHLKPLLNA